MALTKCAECGKEISTAAAACPHCGAPTRAKSWNQAAALILIAIAVLLVGGYCFVR